MREVEGKVEKLLERDIRAGDPFSKDACFYKEEKGRSKNDLGTFFYHEQLAQISGPEDVSSYGGKVLIWRIEFFVPKGLEVVELEKGIIDKDIFGTVYVCGSVGNLGNRFHYMSHSDSLLSEDFETVSRHRPNWTSFLEKRDPPIEGSNFEDAIDELFSHYVNEYRMRKCPKKQST